MNTEEINGAEFNATKMRYEFGPGMQRVVGPPIVLQSLIVPGAEVSDGVLVEAVTVPWALIAKMLIDDPNILFTIAPRNMEELIAAAYVKAGFDEVVLTPRSGDFG